MYIQGSSSQTRLISASVIILLWGIEGSICVVISSGRGGEEDDSHSHPAMPAPQPQPPQPPQPPPQPQPQPQPQPHCIRLVIFPFIVQLYNHAP